MNVKSRTAEKLASGAQLRSPCGSGGKTLIYNSSWRGLRSHSAARRRVHTMRYAPFFCFSRVASAGRRGFLESGGRACGRFFPNDRGSPPSNAASRSFWDVAILKFLMPRQTIGFMHPCGHPIPVLARCNHYELWRERMDGVNMQLYPPKQSAAASRPVVCCWLIGGVSG